MFWRNKQNNDATSADSGYDQGFWDYVESASAEVSDWSEWKKEGWSLVTVGDDDNIRYQEISEGDK